ncbi:hypothetical protein Tco_0684125 [Tanacetum coccineum]
MCNKGALRLRSSLSRLEAFSTLTTCFGSARFCLFCIWFRLFRMILPGYTSALQIVDCRCVWFRLVSDDSAWLHACFTDCRCVWLLGYMSALQIADVLGSGSALVCMHLFGLHRNETPSNTESALWDAPKLRVCFSDLVYFVFDKLSMFTAAAL